jgi:hypothetical protein
MAFINGGLIPVTEGEATTSVHVATADCLTDQTEEVKDKVQQITAEEIKDPLYSFPGVQVADTIGDNEVVENEVNGGSQHLNVSLKEMVLNEAVSGSMGTKSEHRTVQSLPDCKLPDLNQNLVPLVKKDPFSTPLQIMKSSGDSECLHCVPPQNYQLEACGCSTVSLSQPHLPIQHLDEIACRSKSHSDDNSSACDSSFHMMSQSLTWSCSPSKVHSVNRSLQFLPSELPGPQSSLPVKETGSPTTASSQTKASLLIRASSPSRTVLSIQNVKLRHWVPGSTNEQPGSSSHQSRLSVQQLGSPKRPPGTPVQHLSLLLGSPAVLQQQSPNRPLTSEGKPRPEVLRIRSCDPWMMSGMTGTSTNQRGVPRAEQSAAKKSGTVQNGTMKLLIRTSPILNRKSTAPFRASSPPKSGTEGKRLQTTNTNSDISNKLYHKDKDRTEQSVAPEVKESRGGGLNPTNSTLILYPDNHNRPADHEHHTGKFPNLHPSMHPVLFLFLAPPAAAAVAWSEMHSSFDSLSKGLFFFSLFVFLSIIRHLRLFVKDTPFSLSYWAYTFPLAALASASTEYARSETRPLIAPYVAWILVAAASILILVVAVITVYQTVVGNGVFPNDDVVGVCVEQSVLDSSSISSSVSSYESGSAASYSSDEETSSADKWIMFRKKSSGTAAGDTPLTIQELQIGQSTLAYRRKASASLEVKETAV